MCDPTFLPGWEQIWIWRRAKTNICLAHFPILFCQPTLLKHIFTSKYCDFRFYHCWWKGSLSSVLSHPLDNNGVPSLIWPQHKTGQRWCGHLKGRLGTWLRGVLRLKGCCMGKVWKGEKSHNRRGKGGYRREKGRNGLKRWVNVASSFSKRTSSEEISWNLS